MRADLEQQLEEYLEDVVDDPLTSKDGLDHSTTEVSETQGRIEE